MGASTPEVKDVLQKQRKSIIVEAVNGDSFWGSGCDGYRTARTSPEDWPGDNHMGKVLMAIRDKELGPVEEPEAFRKVKQEIILPQ